MSEFSVLPDFAYEEATQTALAELHSALAARYVDQEVDEPTADAARIRFNQITETIVDKTGVSEVTGLEVTKPFLSVETGDEEIVYYCDVQGFAYGFAKPTKRVVCDLFEMTGGNIRTAWGNACFSIEEDM